MCPTFLPLVLSVTSLLVSVPVAAQTKSKTPKAPQPMTIKEIVRRESPAVVAIYNVDEEGKTQGTGSGFLVTEDGVIVTNYHVIEGAHDALIKLKNGEVYDRVIVIDADRRRDLAVLKIQATGLPKVTLGNSDQCEAGDTAVAIGNPKGLEHTVSNGLISARRVDVTGMEGTRMFQISVPISPGSSGGPLFNDRGEVVGVTTSAVVSEGAQNLNFAVELKYVMPVLDGRMGMNISLAELTRKSGRPTQTSTQPERASEPAPPPAPTGATHTDPGGYATITLAQGWKALPPEKAELMNLTNGRSYAFVHKKQDYRDVRTLFDFGVEVFRKGNDVKPDSKLVDTSFDGRPIMVQWFAVTTKENVTLKVLVGAVIRSRGALLFLAVLGESEEGPERDPVGQMFLSLR